MNEIQEKQLAFLEETTNHYNLNNRCYNGYTCRYSPVTLRLEGTSEGCAIGRKLTPDLARKLDKQNPGASVKSVFNELPEELKELTYSFLEIIQALHDSECNWTDIGLSGEGLKEKDNIIQRFGLV